MAKKVKKQNCYCVKIPVELYEQMDAKRIANRHNKTAAVVTMIEAYLQEGANAKP